MKTSKTKRIPSNDPVEVLKLKTSKTKRSNPEDWCIASQSS